MFMKTTRVIAVAALIAISGLVLNVTQAQQVGGRRIDLQRHDLSVTGREVVQTIVELAPGTTAPRHTHPGEEIIYVLEGTWEYTVEGKPPGDPQVRRRAVHPGRSDSLGEECRRRPGSRARDVYRREREAAHHGGGVKHHSFTGVRTGAPLAFSNTTTNLAGSVLLALRPTT